MSEPTLNNNHLAEPFSKIFTDRAEAEWAFDLLREATRRLRVIDPYDPRVAVTLSTRSGRPFLHLNFGNWLVLGFRGPGQTPVRVDMALLANLVAWDERFTSFAADRKEGEPEVRSYHLPLQIVRPLTSNLQQAFETTLDFIAGKFATWKRSPHWKQHNPELVEAFFDPEKRSLLLAGGLEEPELRYERHYTAFDYELAEEGEEYGAGDEEMGTRSVGDGEMGTRSVGDWEIAPTFSESEKQLARRSMSIDRQKINEMISTLRKWYPNWSDFSDPDFVADEIEYKQATIAKARDLLSQSELERLITENKFDEFIDRLLQIGRDNNMLWRSVPTSGDLNVLHQDELDKPTFCEAVFDLLYGSGESSERLERYLNYVEEQALPNKWTFPTYFLFMCHPETEMFVKPRTTKWFVEFLGGQGIYSTKPTAESYAKIREMAHQLKAALKEYRPRDMVDIQSFIWVCRARNNKESDDEDELAEPFSKIFMDREEAEWAFDFLSKTFERLKIKSPDDPRFALTLPYHHRDSLLRLNFGNWLVLDFCGTSYNPRTVDIALFVQQELDDRFERWGAFTQKETEPAIAVYRLPIDEFKQLSDDIKKIYERTFDHIAHRFQDWKGSPYRKYNYQDIGEAVFDLSKRESLFNEGLRTDTELWGADEIEVGADEETKLISPSPNLQSPNLQSPHLPSPPAPHPPTSPPPNPPYPLPQLAEETGFTEDDLARWVRAIERKKQAIFYGPPGTGKTFLAEKLAEHLIGGGDGFRELVQFHPAYAYEDFMQGIRPRSEGGSLSYQMMPGRFLEFCRRAGRRTDTCVLIIDEINRANLSRVFGELMYLLEYREQQIPLAGGGQFKIPPNVRMIGTMNTADRSIALVDHALRRRFAFIALRPNFEVLRHYHRREKTGFSVEGLVNVLNRLNRRIDEDYRVGMTFFMQPTLADEIAGIWQMEIEPYLEEYFFGQRDEVDPFRWDNVKQEILSA